MKSIQKIFRFLLCLLCLLFAVLLIQNAPVVAKGAVQGIRLCLQTVIPSLFCFMVLTCFLINSGLYRFLSLPLARVTRRLFFLPPELGSILLLGMVGGYPMGAKAIASLLQQQKIDQSLAQRMMLYCCCAGPSFIISAVGVQMFGSFSVGVLLFAVQLGVSVLFALVCALHCRLHSSRPAAITDPHPVSSVRPLGLGEAFVLSVAQSVEAMGQMSGFIVLFSALSQLISSLLPCASLARALLLGCLEVTNGCSLASTLPLGAVFASCFLSFGGLSVLAQIMGILKGTHIRILPILLSRLLHALVSGVLTFVLLKSLGESVSVFAAQTHPIPVADPATPFLCLCLIMMGVLLLQQLSRPMQKKHSSLL